MVSDTARSVCDQWGRAHGHDNQFLTGTRLLPTSTTSNSTENGIAVGLRTVQYILSEQHASGVATPSSSKSN